MADPDGLRTGTDSATLLAFVALVTIAGGNAVAIRYTSCATCELDPFWEAAARFGLASVILVVVTLARRAAVPRGRALWGALLFGTLQFGAGFDLVYCGLVHCLPSSSGRRTPCPWPVWRWDR